MNKVENQTLMELLAEMPDHRTGNAIRHKLEDIVSIGLLAILCNANTFTGMQLFGETHEQALREILELPHGIPSHDVFGDVFSRLNLGALEDCFAQWVAGMRDSVGCHNIAIDGKTIRRSGNALHKASHIVTAYASDVQMVLGQVCTDEKSNEITAIPRLLSMLTLRGSTVTIDAMGTQTGIASQIKAAGGEYILSLKDNHPNMLADIRFYMEHELLPLSKETLASQGKFTCTVEKAHGRIEKRECWLLDDLAWLDGGERWVGLQGAALVRSTRTSSENAVTVADRIYLFSQPALTAAQFLTIQRGHWAVENNLHWMLDVQFHEDAAHIRMGHAAVVLNVFRKLSLQLLKLDSSVKGSIASKRLRCAWDFSFALSLFLS